MVNKGKDGKNGLVSIVWKAPEPDIRRTLEQLEDGQAWQADLAEFVKYGTLMMRVKAINHRNEAEGSPVRYTARGMRNNTWAEIARHDVKEDNGYKGVKAIIGFKDPNDIKDPDEEGARP